MRRKEGIERKIKEGRYRIEEGRKERRKEGSKLKDGRKRRVEGNNNRIK